MPVQAHEPCLRVQLREEIGVEDAVEGLVAPAWLAALGKVRKSSIRMPYFGAALECIAGTELVLTATSGVAASARKRKDLRVIEAPPEITGFGFQAVWHPRLETDRAQAWLREQIFLLARDL